MRIGEKTVDYYSIVSGSFGYQIGVQQKDIILVFMTDEAIKKFRASESWQAGVDGTVTVLDVGAEGSIDTTKIKQPICRVRFWSNRAGSRLHGNAGTGAIRFFRGLQVEGVQ